MLRSGLTVPKLSWGKGMWGQGKRFADNGKLLDLLLKCVPLTASWSLNIWLYFSWGGLSASKDQHLFAFSWCETHFDSCGCFTAFFSVPFIVFCLVLVLHRNDQRLHFAVELEERAREFLKPRLDYGNVCSLFSLYPAAVNTCLS